MYGTVRPTARVHWSLQRRFTVVEPPTPATTNLGYDISHFFLFLFVMITENMK
jgi:hypothetical protein